MNFISDYDNEINESLYFEKNIYEEENNTDDFLKNKEYLHSIMSSDFSSNYFEIYDSNHEMDIEDSNKDKVNSESNHKFYFNIDLDLDEDNMNEYKDKMMKSKKQKKRIKIKNLKSILNSQDFYNNSGLKRIVKQFFLNQKRNNVHE